MLYDCIIVGGGIAGLQAAVQLGRSGRSALVIDAGNGRSAMCRRYRNVLGWPDGISGPELRKIGRQQAESYGARFVDDEAVSAGRNGDAFEVRGASRPDAAYRGSTLLLATGLLDRMPDLPGLAPCLGLTVYVCPDCDGYEVQGRKTIVLGAGDVGANMALALSSRTRDIVYINHEYDHKPVTSELEIKLRERGIEAVAQSIEAVSAEGDGQFAGVTLVDGAMITGERGFIAFGGNEVRTDLAVQLGVERMENKHIVTDPRSKMTNVPRVWAAGDAGVHAEQVTIAMGEGAQAAIWINKTLTEAEAADRS
ncbi:pyridine nucleotide-disulfide oxidoreductase [Paenibacillus contaminans]|uniref:Pyridine nucleotide-disulfide oxidoreductase n=1 Tax=Paenibacillus contaminans TaxID=450362 RepID=A0A329MRR6_9BACL|nr:NAD(P)/FAD-dependent oxidoreductase [Paenibacillus contaminans]RAV22484.1 pyridine nucleotide-disulfide oxidoreductase [Paenibacillus contaminans]